MGSLVTCWPVASDLIDMVYLLMADLIENQTLMGIRQTEPKWLLINYTLTFGQKKG
jgi:predicted nuclease of restriction endonuclease-like RecB superfamily